MGWAQGLQPEKRSGHVNKELAEVKGFLEEKDAKLWLEKFFRENLGLLSKILTGVELLEFQSMMIKAMFNVDYFLAICSRGSGKSFICAIFLILYASLNQGIKIGIIANSFRQARLLMQKIIDLRQDPKAKFLAQMITDKDISLKNDEWVIRIGRSQLICLPTGDGCLTLSSRTTYGDSGITRFADVFPKDIDLIVDHQEFSSDKKIWSNGKFRTSDQQFYNGIRDTKRLTTKRGFQIESTLNHKFKCVENGNIAWKEAQNYVIGDNIMIDKSVRWHSSDTELTENECYAFGALIGDGCFGKASAVGFATHDEGIMDRVKLGTPFKWTQCSDKVHWHGGGGDELKFKYLEKFNFKDESSWKTKDKHIPIPVLRSSKSKMSAFIRGLMDTDGSVQTRSDNGKGSHTQVSFFNTSERLIDDLQYVLLHYGIVSNKISRQRTHDKRVGDVNWSKSYELYISGENVLTYANEIGFGLKRKQDTLNRGIANKTRWMSISYDSVPVNINLLEDIAEKSALPNKRMAFAGMANLRRKKIITKSQLRLFIEKYELSGDVRIEGLKQLVSDGVFFDSISSIEDSKAPTADLHVPDGHEYCANGFFSHNSKLRGYRFKVMVIDELLLLSSKLINEVIRPFLSTNTDVTERKKVREAEDILVSQGKLEDKDRIQWGNNKLIGLSSASYSFEYLKTMYDEYEKAIFEKRADNAKYSIFHISYDCLPAELYDQALIASAKAQMSEAQFGREFMSQFTDDSSGYFKMSKMIACTYSDGEGQPVEAMGEKGATYIISGDISWSESDGSDDFVFHVIKYFRETDIGVVVHSYALPGTAMKEHIKYFHFLYKAFSPELIIFDFMGGVQFLSAANESELFKTDGIEIKTIDVEVEDPTKYQEDLKSIRNIHNLSDNRICIQRKPSGNFIRQANEILQAAFDHKRLMFASMAIDDDFVKQTSMPVPVNDLKFLRETMTIKQNSVDFVENLKDNINMIRTQCALIEVASTPQGNQTFDLPLNLKRQRGSGKARKDSYSALVLGNWGLQIYRDMMATPKEDDYGTFEPFIC